MNSELSQALALLPHGPTFRFVDQLTELVPGKSARGEFTLRGDEPFLAGHFPGNPMMPGVLMVEALAQLAGVAAQSDPALGALPGLKLSAMRNVKIHGALVPGETLVIEVTIRGRLGTLIQAEGIARCSGVTLLQADLVLSGSQPDAVS